MVATAQRDALSRPRRRAPRGHAADRRILWLVVAQGLKPREAAPALGCQPDSVRKLTQRALDRARRGLPARQRDARERLLRVRSL